MTSTPSPRGDTDRPASWWARGLLFENCNCQIVCPGHVHFDQQCTFERCVGFWAIRFDAGSVGGVDLAGVVTVVAYDSPRHMIDGGWTQAILVDETATVDQHRAVEAIITGTIGGPWAKLAPFVAHRLPTRTVAIRLDDEDRRKRVSIRGVLESTIEAIRGRDRSQPVTFQNMFNQIHPPVQMIAQGSTKYDDGGIVIDTRASHALYSAFHWTVNGSHP